MRPEYADAIEKGFEWNIPLWQAEEAFPALIDLLQETSNLGQQQAMDETRWQVALKISNAAQRLLREAKADVTAGKTPLAIDEIWDIVEREALRGSPKFANEVVDLRKYVMSMGGEGGVLLKDIISFSKTLKRPRVVTGMVLAAIAKTALGEDGHGAILFRQDLIKAMLSASEKYARGGMQNLADVALITNTLPRKNNLVMQANKMKAVALDLLEQQHVQMTLPGLSNALHLFGIRLVHYVLQKSDPTRGTWNDLPEIGAAFARDIANLTGSEFPCPWGCKKGQEPPPAPAILAPVVKQIDSAGVVSRQALLDQLGVKVGEAFQHKETKAIYEIEEVDPEDHISLAPLDDDLRKENDLRKEVGTAAFLKGLKAGEWRLSLATHAPTTILESWDAKANPRKSCEWQVSLACARQLVNLNDAADVYTP